MQLTVKLVGFHGVPELEHASTDGRLTLSVPDDATVADVVRQLAATYGPVFQPRVSRLSIFAGDEFLEEQARLAEVVRPGAELTIALLRPLRGG